MIGVIYEVLGANVKRPAGLHSANVKRRPSCDPRVAADLVLYYTSRVGETGASCYMGILNKPIIQMTKYSTSVLY